jgi:hypothetical protein
VRADVVQLGEEIRALDLDIQMPNASQEAKADYEQALGAYERASAAVDRRAAPRISSRSARPPEEGRFAMASARARLEGREPPAAHAAVLLRSAPRPVVARGRVVAAVGRAAHGPGLAGRRPARRARRGPRPPRGHGRRAEGALLERRAGLRARTWAASSVEAAAAAWDSSLRLDARPAACSGGAATAAGTPAEGGWAGGRRLVGGFGGRRLRWPVGGDFGGGGFRAGGWGTSAAGTS